MNNKVKLNSSILLFYVFLFVIFLIIQLNHWQDINESRTKITKIAIALAKRDMPVIQHWAHGLEKDSWGNDFLIKVSDGYIFQLHSAGFDKKINTKDDIVSIQIPVIKTVDPSFYVMNEIPEEHGWSVGNILSKAKNVLGKESKFEETEKGWKWSFRWSSK